MRRRLTLKCKKERNRVCLLNTPETQSMLGLILFICVRTVQHLNYGGHQSKKTQFTVFDSDTPVTLEQGQSHQTWCSLVDPKQGYNDAKFEKISPEQCP